MLSNLIGTDLNQKTSLYKEAQTKFPNSTVSYAIDTYQKTENLEQENNRLTESAKKLEKEVKNERGLRLKLEAQIDSMKSSRFWKLRNLVARIIGKEVI